MSNVYFSESTNSRERMLHAYLSRYKLKTVGGIPFNKLKLPNNKVHESETFEKIHALETDLTLSQLKIN